MTSSKESSQIVKNLLLDIILEKILTQIQDKILHQNLNKKISIFGTEQTTNKLLPKIIESTTLTLQKNGKTQFHQDQVPQNLLFKKRNFTKQSNKNQPLEFTCQNQNFQTQKSWLQTYRSTKLQNLQILRNSTINSCPVTIQNENSTIKISNFFDNNKQTYSQKYSSIYLNSHKKVKNDKKSQSKLIKLQIENENQDQFIVKKRQNLLRKKIIQKKLQTLSDTEYNLKVDNYKNLDIKSLAKSQQKPISQTFHSFITDYNGQLIKIKNNILKDKKSLKKQNFSQHKLLKRRYVTVANSPQKVQNFNNVTGKFKKKFAEIQNQTLLKQKANIKVKINTVIEHVPPKSTKPVNFQIIENKKLKLIERNSSDQFQFNQEIIKGSSIHGLKTLKFLHNPLDHQQIVRSLELSPGVTLGNYGQFYDNKQNDTYLEIKTTKSIEKSLEKSSSSIFYDHPQGTLKSILVSKKKLRNELKLKKTHQKHPKFAQIHNQFH